MSPFDSDGFRRLVAGDLSLLAAHPYLRAEQPAARNPIEAARQELAPAFELPYATPCACTWTRPATSTRSPCLWRTGRTATCVARSSRAVSPGGDLAFWDDDPRTTFLSSDYD